MHQIAHRRLGVHTTLTAAKQKPAPVTSYKPVSQLSTEFQQPTKGSLFLTDCFFHSY